MSFLILYSPNPLRVMWSLTNRSRSSSLESESWWDEWISWRYTLFSHDLQRCTELSHNKPKFFQFIWNKIFHEDFDLTLDCDEWDFSEISQTVLPHSDRLLPNSMALLSFICLVGFLTSSSRTRLYHRRVPRLMSHNFMCCHTQDRADRPWLLSQPVTLYRHWPNPVELM